MFNRVFNFLLSILGFFLDRKARHEKSSGISADSPDDLRKRIERKLQEQVDSKP